MQAKTQFVNKLWRNSNSKGCTNFIFHLRTQCCVSISQLCWCQCKHIIHLPPADCTDCSQFFSLPVPGDWALIACPLLSCSMVWSWSDLQARGQQAIIQSLDVLLLISTQGWLRQLLLSTCQHLSVPRGGVERRGVDRIWRDHSKLFPKKIKYTSQNIFRTTRWRTLESARVIIPAHFTQHHHAPLDLTRGGCQRGGRGGGVWQVTAAEWGWQSLVALNTKKMSI